MKRFVMLVVAAFVAVVLAGCAPPGAGNQQFGAHGSAASGQQANVNWYGGAIYHGAPDLQLTAALLRAGSGGPSFSVANVLIELIGADNVNIEIANLKNRYGKEAVDDFLGGLRYTINDGMQQLTRAGTTLPPAPADLQGKELARALIKAGTGPDGIFWTGRLLDTLLSHDVHVQVMTDLEATFGTEVDVRMHKIMNQLMADIARALSMRDVHRAPFH